MDTFEWILGALVAAVVGLLLFLLFIAVDSVGTAESPTTGTIAGKSFTPAHTTTTYVKSGSAFIPITTYHDDSWSIRVDIGDTVVSCPATETQYDAARRGASIVANVSQGRLSGNAYCGGVR